MALRLVIADKQPLIHLGLRALLSRSTQYEIVESCFDANAILPALLREKADLLIVDLDLPWDSGLAMLETLFSYHLDIKVVIFSKDFSAENYLKLIKLGVNGVLLKDMPLTSIPVCLDHVAAGGDWQEKNTVKRALALLMNQAGQKADCPSRLLTKRELDVARLIRAGLSNQEIARKLYVSEGTIKLHLNKAYSKLKIKGRLQLALLAEEWDAVSL